MSISYIENPKTKGSGIICCIPQTGLCPRKCEDCFFQSGRSYLEPLNEHLPNIPTLSMATNKVVRVNDGNDSNVNKELVLKQTCCFPNKFYNTAIPDLDFPAPVVLTINPATMTEDEFFKLDIPKNLMFVRFRVNLWNLELCDKAIAYYTTKEIPVILTFMAYYFAEKPELQSWKLEKAEPDVVGYVYRKRTLNSYTAITTAGFRHIMDRYKYNKFVHSCGFIEGELGDTKCKYCGNCLREYYNTLERMNGE